MNDGNTPLTEESLAGLIPAWVATQGDLNEVEANNVLAGYEWLATRRPSVHEVLDVAFVAELHRRLFGEVWRWAGRYRTVDTNLGERWYEIPTLVKQLVDDFAYRLAASPTEAEKVDATCVDYHHRLVKVHPFPNGNGRHARASADALARALGRPPFSWGRESIGLAGSVRENYLAALRRADRGDLADLARFARA